MTDAAPTWMDIPVQQVGCTGRWFDGEERATDRFLEMMEVRIGFGGRFVFC